MKKTKSKARKTPAPAKKTKPAARKTATPSPAVRKTAPATITTLVSAHVDVGFGNLLYIRGEGSGLSWNKGVPMACVADDRWTVTLPESSRPIVFKFLLNDEIWCSGEDYTALSGGNVVLSPVF
ncbi:MAG: hypothetical protein JWM88_1748 [Verrucomicrobia bacterium]|nr:hypothetical protein [Verrucomicrobiota bacterium]